MVAVLRELHSIQSSEIVVVLECSNNSSLNNIIVLQNLNILDIGLVLCYFLAYLCWLLFIYLLCGCLLMLECTSIRNVDQM